MKGFPGLWIFNACGSGRFMLFMCSKIICIYILSVCVAVKQERPEICCAIRSCQEFYLLISSSVGCLSGE